MFEDTKVRGRRVAVAVLGLTLSAAVSGTAQAAGPPGAAPTPESQGFSGRAGDFDGNGKDDVVSFTRGEGADVYVARSDGGQFVGISDLWSDKFAAWSQAPLTGDFNGDGKSDVVAFTRGQSADVFVALSTGHSFGRTRLWLDPFAAGSSVPAVGDFDGDGKDDVVAFERGHSGNITVALSTGHSFRAPTVWQGSFAGGDAIPAVGDFNGDGKDDVVAFTRRFSGNVSVALSTGRGFTRPMQWKGFFAQGSALPAVGDFDGDGRDDVVAFDGGRAIVALSSGRSFVSTGLPWVRSFAVQDAVPGVGDFNGDGKDDIVAFSRGGTADVYVALSNGRAFRPSPERWHDYFAAATEIPQPGVLW